VAASVQLSPTLAVNETMDYSTDQDLATAHKRCLNGNTLMNQKKYQKACEEYEGGISVMLTASQSETNPIKKKILHDVISFYLTKAEQSKRMAENEELDNEMKKIKEENINDQTLNGTATITTNDDITSGEKQQHCLVQ